MDANVAILGVIAVLVAYGRFVVAPFRAGASQAGAPSRQPSANVV